MSAREARVAVLGLVAALALATGCAGRRVEHGVFHSPKGYRAALPGDAWSVVNGSRADLELRHASGRAGMTVNATCDPAVARRPAAQLTRALFAGLRDRSDVEHGDAVVGGRTAARTVVEGRAGMDGDRLRVEALTVVDGGCVYDLLYAAPTESFDAWHDDFMRFAASFAKE
ncbi:MAG TPA: hypothetical protein VLF19_09745 [Methylomirabilota bacterium]|nr:hypothetical protein [Methylomirabilota bacterium]